MINITFEKDRFTTSQWNELSLDNYQTFINNVQEYNKSNPDAEALIHFEEIESPKGWIHLQPKVTCDDVELTNWINQQIDQHVGTPSYRLNSTGESWLQ